VGIRPAASGREKELKILFVNNFRGRGGGEEFLRDLLPGLAAKGVSIGLICRPRTPLVEMFKDSTITVYPIDRSGFRGVTAVLETARVIRKGGYEIVDIQRGHDIIQSWLGSLFSGKKPVLMYTPQVPEFLKSRFLLSRMEKIVTISRHIRDRIISYDPPLADRTSIIYYGVDLDRFRPGSIMHGTGRKRFGLAPDAPIIGTVGDLWKNQVEFLDALVLIRKEIPGARFALVAVDTGASHVEAFKRRAAELGVTDAILWTGRLSKEDMLSFYMDIDIAVSTHRNEGFGIWVLEALAVGTPVVAVNEGGIRDSLEGCPAGTLVEGGPVQMAAEVLRILKDPELRRRMSEAGPRWTAERYRRERMVDDYYRFFANLIKPTTAAQ
jgi:glycosyltransferase involved in cell wall biosynthesis